MSELIKDAEEEEEKKKKGKGRRDCVAEKRSSSGEKKVGSQVSPWLV